MGHIIGIAMVVLFFGFIVRDIAGRHGWKAAFGILALAMAAALFLFVGAILAVKGHI